MKQKQDFFTALDGRVKFIQGKYNITADPIFLAAFVNAGATGNSPLQVLDIGIGTGGAALALLARAPDVIVTGIDISEEMLAECAENAALNGFDIELINKDILTWRTNRTFDAVITNPPYFRGTPRGGAENSRLPSYSPHHNTDIFIWTRASLRRVKPRGYFYCIIDTARAAEVIAALHAGRAGGIEIVPLFGGCVPFKFCLSPSERVLIRARLGTHTGAKIYNGMSMNDDAVLRDMRPIVA